MRPSTPFASVVLLTPSSRCPAIAAFCLLLCVLAGFINPAAARAADKQPETFTYRTVGDLEIQADVYRPPAPPAESPSAGKLRPVVVWIHGGALILGNRKGISREVIDPLLEAGVVVVSIDYRLAPEVKLPEIISDVEAAFRWIREQGPELFQGDPKRVAVIGGSAGGYLTLISGYRVEPRPVALVPLWGYGDLLGDWLSKPSPHARHRRIELDREAAWQQVAGDPVADASLRKENAAGFYFWCRRTGGWPLAVSGWDPAAEAKKYEPYMPVKNVTAEWPPTLMIHGTEDTDVPVEQSRLMAEQFARHRVPHRLLEVVGAEHGLAGAKPEQFVEARQAAISFLLQHLGVAQKE